MLLLCVLLFMVELSGARNPVTVRDNRLYEDTLTDNSMSFILYMLMLCLICSGSEMHMKEVEIFKIKLSH